MVNKRKILNDPVYGFISIPDGLLFDLIEHPWFQRLRRIKQLGLTHLVYPGALHTRFHHSLGAMYLMKRAIAELQAKGHEITKNEALASYTAILLHDIGHGPYSHTLEHSIADGVSHEYLSKLLMMRLNDEFGGKLTEAIQVFDGTHPKVFLHKLVSSQLDMDRLDYLKRDSFFSGVSEGTVNYERILNMLDVVDDNLVIEAKGIYSVEKFIMARRLMYWQVYLHKTVLVAEHTLMHVLRRAKELRMQGTVLFATPALDYFLKQHVTKELFLQDEHALTMFTQIGRAS
ncbi:MAG: HD domain-containing protein, partial [Bacteroidales bacterium]